MALGSRSDCYGLDCFDLDIDMTKEQILDTIKLLSALESWSFSDKNTLPDYLFDKIAASMDALTKELLT